jgi:hypothetical protein
VIAAIAPTVGLETIIDRWNEIAAALGERNRKTKTTNLETEAIRMKPTTVESTSLATVAYDADHQFLQIEFRDRTIYQYSSVPADVHQPLLRSPSKGSYFNHAIRGQFPYMRIYRSLS